MGTRIDRLISVNFLTYLFGSLVALVSVFLAVDAMSNMMRETAPLNLWAQYYLFYLPAIIYQLMPVAALIGTIFTLSSLNTTNELIALFASGMSLARISAPILIIVGMLSVLSFWTGDWLVPKLNQKKNFVYYVQIKNKPGLYSTVKTNKIWYRSKNIIFNLKTLNADLHRAQQAAFYYFNDAWDLVEMITAEEVEMRESVWELKNGTINVFTEETSFPLTRPFETKVITIADEVGDLQSSTNASDVLSLRELKRFIGKNKEAGLDTLRYEVDYHGKFGFAFATFVMAFLGIPFSVRHQRSGGLVVNMGLCVGLAFLYWAGYSSGLTLGRHGVVPPVLAAWAPNLVTLGLTIAFLLRLKR